jgi:SSS family solute:Na+ symporter
VGLKGAILCALFASLMSTVDSTFNSLATLWSIDIYQTYLRPKASDREVVNAGRRVILVTLFTGILMGLILLHVKFENPGAAFTHTLNELRYYINCGIVVLICGAVFLLVPNHRLALVAFLSTLPLHLALQYWFPDLNYFVRAGWVIAIAFAILSVGSRSGWTPLRQLIHYDTRSIAGMGWGLLLSLIALHIVFH